MSDRSEQPAHFSVSALAKVDHNMRLARRRFAQRDRVGGYIVNTRDQPVCVRLVEAASHVTR